MRDSVLQKQAVNQMNSINQVQNDFLAIHNDLLNEVNKKNGYHDVKKHYTNNQNVQHAFTQNPMFMLDALNKEA